MTKALVMLIVLVPACQLDPLVKDQPGASAHLLPRGATVPSVMANAELSTQLALNDGIDDRAYATAGKVARARGASADAAVSYWSFGPATRAPSPIYQVYDATGPIGAPMVDAIPGDPGYSAMHTLVKLVATPAYDGQIISSVDALQDALDLGLVENPAPAGTFVTSPIVLPGTLLQISDTQDAPAQPVYAHGVEVGMFVLGGDRGIQPGSVLLPTSQVSLVRTNNGGSYDPTKPIFQAQIPAAPADKTVTYTPLSVVVNVDVSDGDLNGINQDSDLFDRTPSGAIMATKGRVKSFTVTTQLVLWQLQFTEGAP